MPPRRPPAGRIAVRVPYDCGRCLLHVDFETDGTSRPEGWQVAKKPGSGETLIWRCAACVREVERGSPEEIG